jgi:tRNA pseudouridine55 synthase
VVARVRRVLRVRKAGHGGTLDPLATGVLPVYLGEGTKLVAFNLEGSKEYQATMKLGQETDTLDADGKITDEKKGFFCTGEEVEEALEGFRGLIRQVPPLYSAVKHEGLPLYQRARAGESPEVRAREVMVYTLSLKEFSFPLVTLEITCGRGTYVRSLCADIGRVLGCGGHLVELRRFRSGRYTLEQAISLENLACWAEQGRIGEKIIPLEKGMDFVAEIRVDEKTAEKVRRGRPLRLLDLPEGERRRLGKGQRVGLFGEFDGLLAIAESQVESERPLGGNPQILRIVRVFQGAGLSRVPGTNQAGD